MTDRLTLEGASVAFCRQAGSAPGSHMQPQRAEMGKAELREAISEEESQQPNVENVLTGGIAAQSGFLFTKGTHLPSAFSAPAVRRPIKTFRKTMTLLAFFLPLILENREIISPGK